jgi:hypothetical protein
MFKVSRDPKFDEKGRRRRRAVLESARQGHRGVRRREDTTPSPIAAIRARSQPACSSRPSDLWVGRQVTRTSVIESPAINASYKFTIDEHRAALGAVLVLALVGCGGSALEVQQDAGMARDTGAGDASSPGDAAGDLGRTDASAATRPDGTCVQNAYLHGDVCGCADGTPSVCGDACVDLTNDDQNCGACGHACVATSVCVSGQCSPPAVVVQPARTGTCGAMDITVSAGELFWADQATGRILRAPVTGGAPSIIAEGEDVPSAIIVNGSTAYWLAGARPQSSEVAALVRAAPITGGAATTVVAPTDGLAGFTVSPDGQTVYVSLPTTVSKGR